MTELGFKAAVDFVIDVLEGGPELITDGGGKTRYGISSKAHPTINIDDLTRDRAVQIYHDEYWTPAGCEMLRWPFNLVVFDTAVNHGVSYAVKARMENYNWAEVINARLARYKHLRDSDPKYHPPFLGWVDRLVLLFQKAKA